MPAEWLSNTSAASERLGTALSGYVRVLSQPANAQRLRRGLILLLVLWAVLALSRLIWALLPAETLPESTPTPINPVAVAGRASTAAPVDIEKLVAWHLFGSKRP